MERMGKKSSIAVSLLPSIIRLKIPGQDCLPPFYCVQEQECLGECYHKLS